VLLRRAHFDVANPRRFNTRALVIISAYGLVLAIPALVSMMAVSVMEFGWGTFAVPLLTVLAATYFLPFGFGNPHVTRLAHQLPAADSGDGPRFVVQISTSPRLCQGLRALFEDADDIGWLSVAEEEVVFNGDRSRLSVPYGRVRELRQCNGGWRWLFLYGPSIEFSVDGLPEFNRFRFAERSGWVLTTSKKNGRKLYSLLRAKIDAAGGGKT
jgi:hypothetical protein